MILTLTFMAIAVAALGTAGVATLSRRLRREWTCTWQGHTIELVAGQNNKALFFDGKQVAQKTTLSGMGSSLSWTFQDEGKPVVLSAVIGYPDRTVPVGRIYANGQWIGGADRELATTAVHPSQALPQPTDPRWQAAQVLLSDLRAAGDTRLGEAADRIEGGLRDVLGRLEKLAAARNAHRVLGGDQTKLDFAQSRLDAQAAEVVDALRDFHLIALAEGPAPSLDRFDDLLARVAADSEVEDVSRRTKAVGRRRQGQA